MAYTMHADVLMRYEPLKHRLLERRRELLLRYHAELARAEEELASRESEDIENATEQWDARVLSLLGDADAKILAQIVAALRRLEAGTYGACVECESEIEPSRLLVLPEAATCFECALESEPAHAPRFATGQHVSPSRSAR
jgi:RNA polymerase-binding transcription factor DksA